MKLLVFVIVTSLAAGCSAPQPAPASGQPERPDTGAPHEQTQSPAAEITITSVTATNPVVIEGLARTFENNVVVRLRDSTGALIRETFTTSDGEMGHHNPYRAEVFVTRDPGGRITAEALEYSARDGSERSLVARTIDYDVEIVDVQLYLPERNPSDCSIVHAEAHRLPKSISMARLLVEALIADPRSPFPEGSAVSSIALRNGVVTVDFNERLQNVGGSCRAMSIRAAVERTLGALPSVNRVVITASGSEKLALQP